MSHRIVLIVLFTAACAGLARLGWWQLDRAEQKRERHNAYRAALAAGPVDFSTLSPNATASVNWRQTTLRGHYLEQTVLLDNRAQSGQAGYEVLTPFRTTTDKTILVNRGWTPLPASRSQAPAIASIETREVRLAGYLAAVPVVGIALNEAARLSEWLTPGILRVQRIEIGDLAETLNHRLWPQVLYLDPGQPGALKIDWQQPGDGSDRHTAYAVQWFAMSAVLALIGLWHLRRTTKGPGGDD